MDTETVKKLEFILGGTGTTLSDRDEIINLMDEYAENYYLRKVKNGKTVSGANPICSCGNSLTDKEVYYNTCLQCFADAT